MEDCPSIRYTPSMEEESLGSSEEDFIDTDEEEFSCEEQESISTSHKLLSFAYKISKDIFMHFHSKTDNEDHCDVYENKFSNTISGRDLYYADLLAVARHGENAETSIKCKKIEKNHSRCDWPCSGIMNPDLGLGPLSELFEHLDRNPNARIISPPSQDQNYLEIPQLQQYEKSQLALQDSIDANNLYSELNKIENDLSDILENWTSENLSDSFSSHFLNFIAGQ
ncbi:uncharacterized protein LOC111622149 [Centruroides sculpturatus]|uniref:uncharacterized protein LOC111622149 n=1 Tax=Centruroides sculpturatus TaxID=218467 RepID=UPI000C6E3D5B|nr:uncharacterized protein LOC111622149 [Centruroides sculpturatus]